MGYRKSPRRIEKERKVARWRELPEAAFVRFGAPREALAELELALVGKIVLPDMPEYNQDRQESNPRFQAYPQIIVYCAVASDVALCLLFAQQNGLWIAVRSGGHSTAGFSVNSGIVIDTSWMSFVSVNTARMVAFVGPGTDFDTLNAELDQYALHVPSGACGNVCVAGFMQGGGYGYTSRKFGMNCDNVVGVTVMLYDTSIVQATADVNSDLFWAVRGGTGGNFGVLLQVTFQLYDLPSVWAWAISWNIGDAPAALVEMQTNYMSTGAPPDLGYMVNVGMDPTNAPVLLVQGMFTGSAADGKAALSSLLSLGSAQLVVDQSGLYGAMDSYLDDHPYVIPNPPDGALEDKQSGYVATPITASAWTQIIQYYLTTQSVSNTIVLEPYGGAINAYPTADSAFIHRTADMNFFVDVFWTPNQNGQAIIQWLNGFMELMNPYFNGEMYQNYPRDIEYDYRAMYWGTAFDQLLAIKQKYDPNNVFRYAQSISPYPTAVQTPSSAPRIAQSPIAYDRHPKR